ncbi:benzodiazapine receptor [Sporothrix schenckii 1099-18]|uniref:TspO/MBR family protein n=2 Tax=Sporothrix schenckii TaxID=29908 RepID=U7PS07_SPOS1|nr:benzodiazapine receptor [Sporothrix schenckii 1099-18]ERS98403.1 hypothetical protein HMPREF1624_05187 [Sporothrix schenckii ATCC 58251]KJR89460.1 benzodiazapine receptor [Sporothrix schenckii 1099-18]
MTSFVYHFALPEDVFASPAASILLPIALGTAVGYSTRPKENDPEVNALKQPPFRPPPRIFGPVWTLLYGTMGYAAHLAIGQTTTGLDISGHTKAVSAGLYTLQLGLNLAWMPLFFSLKRPVEATVDVVALLGINGYLTALWLDNVSTETAGWLMVPYVSWLAFATYLSAGTGYLNGWSFGSSKATKKE